MAELPLAGGLLDLRPGKLSPKPPPLPMPCRRSPPRSQVAAAVASPCRAVPELHSTTELADGSVVFHFAHPPVKGPEPTVSGPGADASASPRPELRVEEPNPHTAADAGDISLASSEAPEQAVSSSVGVEAEAGFASGRAVPPADCQLDTDGNGVELGVLEESETVEAGMTAPAGLEEVDADADAGASSEGSITQDFDTGVDAESSSDDQGATESGVTIPPAAITIGSSLGWVDLLRGILLLRSPFDEHPAIEYIPFPASRPPCSQLSDHEEEGGSDAPQYFRDVACCNDLIKLVDVEYHDPSSCRPCCGRDKSWEATIWNRKLSSGDWRRGFTVDVADISLDQTYSALLPELWDDETEKLHLKKLIFYTPTLSICDDDLLYVMSKVNDEDDKAWVITVDMKHAVVQAVAPFSAGDIDILPMYRPCSFPKYLNMTPGVDITNTVHKYFTRMDVEKCFEELLWTRDWLRELGQCLEHERSVYIDCSSLHFCPVSSLRFTTPAVVEYASSVGEGKAKAASEAVDVCLRALEDFNLLLRKPPSDAPTSTKSMRRKINTALKALKNVLQIAPQSMMAGGTTMDGATTLANACHQKRRKPVFERRERPGHKIQYIQSGFSGGKLFCDRCKKLGHEKDKCDDEHQVELNRQLELDEHQVELNRQLELNLHGSLGPWLSSLPQDVWFILAIAFSALVRACLRYLN